MQTEPLHNRRIAITRTEAQAGTLIDALRAYGAIPLVYPLIAIVPPLDFGPLDTALDSLDSYDWLLITSANGANALFERMQQRNIPTSALSCLQIGVIGPSTAKVLTEHGIHPTFMPSRYVAESALTEIGDVKGQRILLPRSDIARDMLVHGLRERGALVDDVTAYRTIPGPAATELLEQQRQQPFDAILFGSSSAVRYLLNASQTAGLSRRAAVALLNKSALICIGPITAATAEAELLRVAAVAESFTAEGLISALQQWFEEHPNDPPAH